MPPSSAPPSTPAALRRAPRWSGPTRRASSPPPLSGPAAVGAIRREGSNTTHFSVVDAEGNAVANTYTLNDTYGAAITIAGLGVLLNNTMDDFTTQPGAPNALFHLVQSDGNKVEPGKRPLSSKI